MAKKKGKQKGKTITLKMAQNATKMTAEGKHRLDLSNMDIETFPKCLLKLNDLDELDLSRNQLQKIPDFICELTKICWLDLHSNKIEMLPKSIGQLELLCHLNLCDNKLDLESLPNDIGKLKNLKTLNLGMNQLTALPSTMAGLSNLTEVGLFDNQLTAVPEFIKKLPNLKKINTKRNPIIDAQGDADVQEMKETDGLYLVIEADLCAICLQKCRERKMKFGDRLLLDHSRKRSHFPGLITPNSVAKSKQEVWRTAIDDAHTAQ